MAPDITLFPIQQTMPSPLISVIVPIYNMESLLPRCLDSLAAQTLRDLEILFRRQAFPPDYTGKFRQGGSP